MPTKNPAKHPDLESVMFTEAQIKSRVRGLGREIRKTFGDGEFTIVSIINGAVMFTADLMREIEVDVRYTGFEIPNRFVIGYGLDFAERYRNLPYVGVLHDELMPEGV